MIQEQSALVRAMFYVVLFMFGILIALIALNLRQPYAGLVLLSQEDGGVRSYGHTDSFGLTEVFQDAENDGMPEFHIYRVAVSVEAALVSTVSNTSGVRDNHDSYVLQYTSKKRGQRSAALSVTDSDEAGLYRVCNISFSDGVSKPDTSYSDWDFDGRIDVEVLGQGSVMNVRMGDQWLPVLMNRPMVHREYVTVVLDEIETRLDFLDGEFVPATQ